MRAGSLPDPLCCSSPGLLTQVIEAAASVGVALSGENALQRYDQFAFDRIAESAFGHLARAGRLEQLTFLRMGDLMFDNWCAVSVCGFIWTCCCFRYCTHSLRCMPHMWTCMLRRAGTANPKKNVSAPLQGRLQRVPVPHAHTALRGRLIMKKQPRALVPSFAEGNLAEWLQPAAWPMAAAG